MKTWLIEPRDPLIVRDGRPFDSSPGARAKSLPFPFPATIAGALRHKAGLLDDGSFDKTQIQAVKQIACRGPVLVSLTAAGDHIAQWYAPAPADALILTNDDDSALKVRQLVPSTQYTGMTNLPVQVGGHQAQLQLIVQRGDHDKSKPSKEAPAFWSWERLQQWLLDPSQFPTTLSPSELGLKALKLDSRTHVGIVRETQAAEDGRLFQTSGLTFDDWTQRLALAAWVEDQTSPRFRHFSKGFAAIGGERRLARWQPIDWRLPTCPAAIKKAIIAQQCCRLLLVTPAIFDAGYCPQAGINRHQCTPSVVAASSNRYQVISGWDLETSTPRPTRRLAPAGSVYFIDFGSATPDQIDGWIDATWGQPISDAASDQLDGFGIALLGTWAKGGA